MSSPATSKPGFDHVLDRNALRAQMLLQREALAAAHSRCETAIASPAKSRGRRDSRAPWRRCARPACRRRISPQAPSRHAASCGAARGARHPASTAGSGTPAIAASRSTASGKPTPSVSIKKRDDVAVLAGGEVVVKSLLVVDGERRRLLLLERRQPLPLPPRLLQLHAPAHDFRNRKPGAQFVEELGRKAHVVSSAVSCGRCQPIMDIGERR